MAVDPQVLADFLKEEGLAYKQNSVSYIFTCPRCSKAKKLYIRKKDGRFVCWHCRGASLEDSFEGRAEYALAEILGVPLQKVTARLYLREEMPSGALLVADVRDWFGDGEEVDEEAEPLARLEWPLDYHPIDHPHAAKGAAYLEGRGVPLPVASAYGVRYCPRRKRVVFPVSYAGALYGWQERLAVPHRLWDDGRSEWKELPKTLSSKAIPRDRLVMFSDRLEGSEHAVVCEGPVDALKAHLCGGNVATMGKGVARQQIQLLRMSGIRKVYVALDPDAGAETMQLVKEFSDMEVHLMDPSPRKDLGEMSMEEVLELFRSAPRVCDLRLFVPIRR